MADLSPEQIAQIRERLASLSPEEKQQLVQAARRQVRRADLPITDEGGNTLSFPHMPLMRPENLDPSTPEGKANTAMMLASGLRRPVAGAFNAVRSGVGALAGYGGQMLGRAAAGGAVGAAAGSVPVPFLGKLGAKEGAMIGAGFAVGKKPGGAGPLFKHRMKVSALQRLLGGLGLGAEEAAAGGGVARAAGAARAVGGGAAEDSALLAAERARRAAATERAVAGGAAPAGDLTSQLEQSIAAAKGGGQSLMPPGTQLSGAAPGGAEEMAWRIRQLSSMPGGKEAVAEWLKTQPREVVDQLIPLLESAGTKMGTVFGGGL